VWRVRWDRYCRGGVAMRGTQIIEGIKYNPRGADRMPHNADGLMSREHIGSRRETVISR
jgi:hypothetical protein